jgi:predicted metalloendopeptidase
MYGSEQELSRWRDCVSYVNDHIGNAVGRMFVEEYFDEDANWHDRLHKTKKNKTKPQYNMCWTPLYTQTNTNNLNNVSGYTKM